MAWAKTWPRVWGENNSSARLPFVAGSVKPLDAGLITHQQDLSTVPDQQYGRDQVNEVGFLSKEEIISACGTSSRLAGLSLVSRFDSNLELRASSTLHVVL